MSKIINIKKCGASKIKDLLGSAFRSRKTTTGFTLIELLVVISIIGFLSSVVIASMQTARDKAITAKITEDLRQVQIAAELAFGENDNYIFTLVNPNENILANNEISLPEDNSDFFIKTASAETLIVGVPPACALFDTIVDGFVSKKYIAARPVHPKQNYPKGICYKAATSTDGSYFAAYAETPAEFVIDSSSAPKSVGFVVGNRSFQNLENIRTTTRSSGSGNGYLQTTNNQTIASTADIADEVIGVTSGLTGNYGTIGGSSGGGGTVGGATTTATSTVITCPSGEAVNPSGVCQTLYTGLRLDCNAPAVQDPFTCGCIGEVPYSCGITYISNTVCGNYSILTSGGVCSYRLCTNGSRYDGSCPTQRSGIYECRPGTTFVIDGKQNTQLGTCI